MCSMRGLSAFSLSGELWDQLTNFAGLEIIRKGTN